MMGFLFKHLKSMQHLVVLSLFFLLFKSSCKHKEISNFEPNQENDPYIIFKLLGNRNKSPTPGGKSKIISMMKTLGYTPNESGVCYGMAYMGVQAAIRKNIAGFVSRVEKIKRGDYDSLVEKTKRTESLTQKESSEKLDLLGFLDGVTMYTDFGKLPNFGGQDWKKNYKNFNKDLPKIRATVGSVSTEQMREMIRHVLNAEVPIALTFINNDHTTALLKGTPDHVLFVDHDTLELLEDSELGASTVLRAMPDLLSVEQITLDTLEPPMAFEKILNSVRKEQKSTQLVRAAINGHLDIVKYLVEQGNIKASASIKEGTSKGLTPLYVAAQSGHLDIVKYLVTERGVDASAPIKKGPEKGKKPLDIAKDFDIKKFLRDGK